MQRNSCFHCKASLACIAGALELYIDVVGTLSPDHMIEAWVGEPAQHVHVTIPLGCPRLKNHFNAKRPAYKIRKYEGGL